MTARVLIIPAAGSGSRLGSTRPKFLTPVGGRSMISYLIELYLDSVELFAVVVHPTARAEGELELASVEKHIRFFEQRDRTGMLDAIVIPRTALETLRPLEVWVTWCDQIAINQRTIGRLSSQLEDDHGIVPLDLLFPTMRQEDPYIHFVRDSGGQIVDVLHARESDDMPRVGESDMGLFRLSDRAYFELLPEYSSEAALGGGTGERNFLPFIPWLARRGHVETFPGHNPIEALGINTPEDLERIERYLRDGK